MLFQICFLWALLCPQEPQPTLPETLEFISSKLPELATYTGKSEKNDLSERVTGTEGNACNLTVRTFRERSGAVTITDEKVITVNLAHLQPGTIKTVNLGVPPIHILAFQTKEERKTVNVISVNRSPLGLRRYEDAAIGFTFVFDSKENAERIQKAFAHASKLCSEKKEPF